MHDVLGAPVIVGVFAAESVERNLDFVFGQLVTLSNKRLAACNGHEEKVSGKEGLVCGLLTLSCTISWIVLQARQSRVTSLACALALFSSSMTG